MGKPRIGHLAVKLSISSLSGFAVFGCHRHDPAPFPEWAVLQPSYSPRAVSENAFDAYAMAALRVEESGGKYLLRVSFYPEQRKAVEALCASPLAELVRAEKQPCRFEFTARPPFVPAPYQRGWRLLGHALKWSIDDACHAGNYDRAIDDLLAATRFGFDLTAGGPTDASLGLAIADEARIAIAPSLPKMGAAQLQRLGDGIQEDLAHKPDIAEAIRHDGEDIRLAVQTLQDAVRKDDFHQISENLGSGVKEAVNYLRDLRDDDDKRAAYFKSFAEEGEAQIRFLTDNSALPAERRSLDAPADPLKEKPAEKSAPRTNEKKKERPWHSFSRQFFLSSTPLLELNDRTVARTRLLALNAELIKASKVEGAFPKDLRRFPSELATDPYTGSPFLYRADAAEYEIYSVGSNFRDDAGDTDDSFSFPDLKLELKD